MKVLFLTRDLPYPATNGYKKRNFYLLKELARRKMDVVLFSPDSAAAPEALKSHCKEAKVIKVPRKNKAITAFFSLFSNLPFSIKIRTFPDIKREIEQYVMENPVDVIICDSVYRSLNIPIDIKACKILYEHNIESMIIGRYTAKESNIFKKLFAFIEHKKLQALEKRIWGKFDLCIACSEIDKKIIENKAKDANVFVINNGVDSNYFIADSYPTHKNSLVYTGQISWYPNEDALIYFLTTTFPLIKKQEPETLFWIVGDKPSKRLKQFTKQDKSILITGFVNDVREYIGDATVYIAPLRIGSGTRLKILEALSMKKAVVSTSVGCEGLAVENNKHLLIRDNPQEFAQAVLGLLKDEALRKKLGENGRRLIEEKYDWDVVFSNLDEILKW